MNPTTAPPSPSATVLENSPLILIVDDNPDDRENCIRALKKVTLTHYRYLEAESGERTKALLSQRTCDCMLLDYSLPGENGLELLKQIKGKNPDLPVIMMTGQGNETIAAQAIKEGAQYYLIKSEITPDVLHGNIKAAIEQRALEHERSELIRRLIESNTELERFAYVASHDLQEPVRMIVSFSKILTEEYGARLDAAGSEYLGMISAAGARMHDMVEDLLDYSRLGNESSTFTYFSAKDMLVGALSNIQKLVDTKNATITFDALPTLYGNPIQIMRLLQNLITNAIKYQAPGNAPRIHIGCEDTEEAWHICVTDNGIGVEEKFLNQIFQPFRRLHVWEQVHGTGLGLSICKKIAENHGGKIWVTSKMGEGSVFHFTLSKSLSKEKEAA